MTEEIIINGVDVAGCSLYLNGNGKCLRLLTDNEPETECNAICDYGCLYHKEQLKRLEQENRELRQVKKDFPDIQMPYLIMYRKVKEECYKLEQENKELKKQIESQKGLITVGGKQQYEYLQKIEELEQENKELKTCIEMIKNTEGQAHIEGVRLAKENKELKEWKDKVVKLFESACRCKYLNEEKDICSYTNEKCININKCVYKYQELSGIYRSALEEIKNKAENYEIIMRKTDLYEDDCNNCPKSALKEIISMINEVLNA